MLKTIGIVLQEYLAQQNIESASQIWVNHTKTEDGISIYETGGSPSRLSNASDQVFTVQVKTKYSNPSQGSKYSHEVIEDIKNLLIYLRNEEIIDTHIRYIHANQPPTFMKYENKRMVYVCNFTICVKI